MKTKTNLDFLKYRKFSGILSGCIILLGIIMFIIRGGFNYGLDFQGGVSATIVVNSEEIINIDDIRSLLQRELMGVNVTSIVNQRNTFDVVYKADRGSVSDIGVGEIVNTMILSSLRRRYGEGIVVYEIEPMDGVDIPDVVKRASDRVRGLDFTVEKYQSSLPDDRLGNIINKFVFIPNQKPENYKLEDFLTALNRTILNENNFELYELVHATSVDSFEPTVGQDIQNVAFAVAGLIIVLILGYLALRFQFKFGVAAVLAVLHDSLIMLSIISITGIEIGIQTVTAILMIIGYSLNDTIVVFDRIRENSENIKKEEYTFVINRSINETLGRTIITSVTTLLAVLALLFLGGGAIFELAFSISIGIVVGTYSSIFIASPVLIIWEEFLDKRKEKKEEKKREQKKQGDKRDKKEDKKTDKTKKDKVSKATK